MALTSVCCVGAERKFNDVGARVVEVSGDDTDGVATEACEEYNAIILLFVDHLFITSNLPHN